MCKKNQISCSFCFLFCPIEVQFLLKYSLCLAPFLFPRHIQITFLLLLSVSLDQCKLDYQACITGKKITVKCPGMCPCTSYPAQQSSSEKKGTHFSYLLYFSTFSHIKSTNFKIIHWDFMTNTNTNCEVEEKLYLVLKLCFTNKNYKNVCLIPLSKIHTLTWSEVTWLVK